MKPKKAGIITKIVILILIVYATVSMINLRIRVKEAEAEKAALTQAVVDKAAANAELSYEIAHINDPQTIENIAREKLGLLRPGEKVFYRVSN